MKKLTLLFVSLFLGNAMFSQNELTDHFVLKITTNVNDANIISPYPIPLPSPTTSGISTDGTLIITPASAITDGEGGFTELEGAQSITAVEIGTKTYALVVATIDDGVQIIQSSPSPTNNNAPVIAGGDAATVTVTEGITEVTTISASDDDDDSITYSLSGDDATLFTITPAGVLTFNTAPDFENPTDVGTNNVYNLTVTADDGNEGTDTQTITVTVIDNTPLTGIALSATQVKNIMLKLG